MRAHVVSMVVVRAVLLCLCTVPQLAFGEVTKVNVATRVTVANGQAFGPTGPYEKLTGTIEFAVDPKEPHNARITDIDRATPGTDNRVHFTSDLMVLKPFDPAKGNGVLLFEVVNRGNILLLNKFNSAPYRNPTRSTFHPGCLARRRPNWMRWSSRSRCRSSSIRDKTKRILTTRSSMRLRMRVTLRVH